MNSFRRKISCFHQSFLISEKLDFKKKILYNGILKIHVQHLNNFNNNNNKNNGLVTGNVFVMKKKLLETYKGQYKQEQQQRYNSEHNSDATASVATNLNTNILLPLKKIPGPKGLPIIGTTLDIIAAGSGPQLHKYIDNRHHKYGTIFRERLGGTQDAIFISSASLMRSVFLYEGQYPTHPLPDSWTLYNNKHKCRRGLFFMNGPEWLHNRRIMNRLLLHGDNNWINGHINKSTIKLIDNWKELCKSSNKFTEIHYLEKQLYRWSIDVLTLLFFGDDFDGASIKLIKKIDKFSNNVHKIFETSAHLMTFPPKLAQLLNMKIWTEFEMNVTKVLELGNEIVDSCINEIGCGNGLLIMMKKYDMPLEDIKRIFIDLIIAAGDTTAFSTQWALYLLANKKNIQKRTEYELECRKNENSLKEIPYIKGLIRETLRLFPVAPFIGRFLANDAIIGSYKIDKNTLVLLSLYTSGRDADHFPNPLEVKPERWLRHQNGELTEVLQPNGTLPFAIGSRSCIGRKIALSQMNTLIQMLISNFELTCLNETEIDIVLRLVAVPDQPVRLGLKKK